MPREPGHASRPDHRAVSFAPRSHCNAARVCESIHNPTPHRCRRGIELGERRAQGSRGGAWGNLSSLDGFGRRAGQRRFNGHRRRHDSQCCSVRSWWDCRDRSWHHSRSGPPVRGINLLIAVAAGEDKCCDHDRDAEPHGRFPTHWSRPVGRSFGQCAGEVGHHTLRRRGWRSH